MSNMQNYLSALATLFENPQEDISETMWMKMQWCYLSQRFYSMRFCKFGPNKPKWFEDGILVADLPLCRYAWIFCLATYRASGGGPKAAFITTNWVIGPGSPTRLSLAFTTPRKIFSAQEEARICGLQREIFASMHREAGLGLNQIGSVGIEDR